MPKSRPLLPFSIPLLNSGSAFFAPFPHRGHRAPASAPPGTAMPSPPTVSVPVIPILASPPIPPIIAVPIVSFIVIPIPPMPRAQTPAPAPANSVTAVPPIQLSPQFPTNQLHVHEITVSAAVAVVFLELAARGFPEIRHRREVCDNWAAIVEAALQGLQGRGGLILLLELDIDVADHVIGEVVADVEALDLAELV